MSCRDCAFAKVGYEQGSFRSSLFVDFGWKITLCGLPGGKYNDGKELSNPDGVCPSYKNKMDLAGVFK